MATASLSFSIPPPPPTVPRGYTVQSVVRACDILRSFRSDEEELNLNDIAKRCTMNTPTALRLLHTLTQCGMVERRQKQYRLISNPKSGKRYRIGFGAQGAESSFARLVAESVQRSALEARVELIMLDNRYNSKIAIRNAEAFAREGVDLVIEFQTDERCAATISGVLAEKSIPMIAIEIPHPGALYFGANNHRAGYLAGRRLAHACIAEWKEQYDEILLMDLAMAGPLPKARLTGILDGLREILPTFAQNKVCVLDGAGRYQKSFEVVRKHLKRSFAKRVLLSGVNDPGCLGALHAFVESGRAPYCFAVGQNATIEARREMRNPGSRLIGSVGYFPESYGDAVMSLAMKTLQKKELPSAVFTKHTMITPNNVNKYYPNDNLISETGTNLMLYSMR